MDARLPLSVLLLLRDERLDVEALLPTLGFAREVVVVWDPRGDRAARDAAERLGARVIEHDFTGFGAQRAAALLRHGRLGEAGDHRQESRQQQPRRLQLRR